MKTNQSLNSLISSQAHLHLLHQKDRGALQAHRQLAEAKRDLVATADRIYEDEDDREAVEEEYTEDS